MISKIIKNASLPFIGFLQATGLVFYVAIIVSFMDYISKWPVLTYSDEASFIAPIIFLLILVISAVACAAIFLGKAAVLFWNKKYIECFKIIIWTLVFSIMYILLFFILLLPSTLAYQQALS
ncbi:MAG: hypothetical protein ACD_22C00172G0008 [uncultured bacterium]|uniref:Uncharacterized protein n=1 Tax=candidate division WWE3 bacterium RBG_16_37_10 TaxID=1802610 RepID=A0A1F4V3H4_UNCKA|nr:MAG: hypothetical protein ACD_22C00172G0008 [uncultured bacterium]OGC51033.1 MAG: hypothetical protein A2W32_01720 [candidate division WWE3 bacterium RBG_16_37_10]